jgi:two-component system, NtrC family, sensor kinase
LQGLQNAIRRISPDLEANRRVARECGVELEAMGNYLEKRGILRYFDGMRDAGSRAARIVANMLNFSRKSESNRVPVEINDLIDQVLELAGSDYDLKKQYDFRRIHIVRDYGDGLPRVYCITTEIEQVLLNLLRNAAQAMAEMQETQESRIIIRTRKEEGHMVIEIEDNGPGIDEGGRKQVFEPFFTTKAVGIGTGLGLSVSFFIVANNHNGTLSVESEREKGARFIIRLPLAER